MTDTNDLIEIQDSSCQTEVSFGFPQFESFLTTQDELVSNYRKFKFIDQLREAASIQKLESFLDVNTLQSLASALNDEEMYNPKEANKCLIEDYTHRVVQNISMQDQIHELDNMVISLRSICFTLKDTIFNIHTESEE